MAVKNGKWVLLLLALITTSWAQVDQDMLEESINTEVSLDEFDLEETCVDVAEARWNYHLNPTKENLQKKIKEEKKYGSELKQEAERMAVNLELPLKSPELQRKIELLTKPGAPLLSTENFNKMVDFSNRLEEIKYTKYNICPDSTIENACDSNLQDIKDYYTKPHVGEMLLHVWKQYSSKWPDVTQNFSAVLHFANDEATLNGAPDVQRYWEDITEFPPGYNRAVSLWNQIQPLYKQLQQSISSLISKHYKIQNKATIPIVYLGSITGTDWSSVADILYTRSSSQYKHIIQKLEQKRLGSFNLYRLAESMVERLGLEKINPHFWNESKFDYGCPTKVISLCKEVRITTCRYPSWPEYLNAHEVMMQAAHKCIMEEGLIFRVNNHHSALYEAVSGLGPVLAATPKQLELQGILPPIEHEEVEDDVKYTFLILTALRTLPQLPYYLAADLWRLEAIKNNETDLTKLKDSWIKLREEMQMVSVPENDWFQLLSDPYIVNNKPYLGKFIGVILQFQLLEYFLDNEDVTLTDAVQAIGSNGEFRTLLKAGFSKPWPDAVEDIAKISYIDARPLLNFFGELEDALDQEIDVLPVDTHSSMINADKNMDASVERKDDSTEAAAEKNTAVEIGDEASSTEMEDKALSSETETETVTGIRLSDVQNQNVSAEIPTNTETENKAVESSGAGTILLFSITAAVAVIAVVVFFLVGRKRFIRSHIYRQPPDQNAPA